MRNCNRMPKQPEGQKTEEHAPGHGLKSGFANDETETNESNTSFGAFRLKDQPTPASSENQRPVGDNKQENEDQDLWSSEACVRKDYLFRSRCTGDYGGRHTLFPESERDGCSPVPPGLGEIRPRWSAV